MSSLSLVLELKSKGMYSYVVCLNVIFFKMNYLINLDVWNIWFCISIFLKIKFYFI